MEELNIHEQLLDFRDHVDGLVDGQANQLESSRNAWVKECLIDFHARSAYLQAHVSFSPNRAEALSVWIDTNTGMASGDILTAKNEEELGDAILRVEDNLEGYMRAYGHLPTTDYDDNEGVIRSTTQALKLEA